MSAINGWKCMLYLENLKYLLENKIAEDDC
jgi:hypothetical protein